jgi:carboxylesterase type B
MASFRSLYQTNNIKFSAFPGLFHRAISQSGTALGPFAFASTEIALANTMKVASLLHCHAVNTTELVTCLRTKNATDIIEKLSEFQVSAVSYCAGNFIFNITAGQQACHYF